MAHRMGCICRIVVCLAALAPHAALHGALVFENSTGVALNPAGLANESVLVSRISLADTNTFLLSDAHLDLGGLVSLSPIGGFVMGRVKFSPLLFLDLGFMAGGHFIWKHHTFAPGTTDYGPSVLDSLPSKSAFIPCITPFWVIKLKFGPLVLYNSFYLEKFYTSTLWYYWFPELMVRNGWVFSWNSYALLQVSPELYLLFTTHLQKSYDTGDARLTAGPGLRYDVDPACSLVFMAEYHLKEVNFSGLKVSAGLEIALGRK